MAHAKQMTEPRSPAVTWANTAARLRSACLLVSIATALFCLSPTSRSADSYSTVIRNHLELETQTPIEFVPPQERLHQDAQIADLKRAVATELETLPSGLSPVAPPRASQKDLVASLLLPAGALLAIGSIFYLIRLRYKSVVAASDLTASRAAALLVENPSLVAFFEEFREGLNAPVPAAVAPPVATETNTNVSSDPLQAFLDSAPDRLADFRKRFSEISQSSDTATHRSLLIEFLKRADDFKGVTSRLSEFRPAWLTVCALEGLLKQLSSSPGELTPSVLATTAAALDLLESLCVRGVNPDLANDPPVRLLAVDDDPVSRLAISFALKRAFDAPDVVPDAETALRLVANQTYDVVFLDVDMPGMDGFELCTRIQQAAHHRNVPVVFVTRHSDFDSRAKSTLSGGQALIGKPYLAFEITVKALTLALRGRLNGATVAVEERELPMAASEQPSPPSADSMAVSAPARDEQQNGHENQSPIESPKEVILPVPEKASADSYSETFISRAPALLENLRYQLRSARNAFEPAELHKYLGQLYVGAHSFNVELERAELRVAFRVSSALEGMLKKLLEHNELYNSSILDVTAVALELLEDLCAPTEFNYEFINSPVSILAVDDDPTTLRAISGAVQLVFGRPDGAENGEIALTLASEKPYDLIFMDVLMPGIDGFTACSKIHECGPNSHTPVVFITGHAHAEARSKAVANGCGLIPKPFLSSQIKLAALTFILRNRVDMGKPMLAQKRRLSLQPA
jgi:CheY-like chemotaxis protein